MTDQELEILKLQQQDDLKREEIQADVRKVVYGTLLEENSSDSDSYKGLYDLFTMPNGKGAGVWALRVYARVRSRRGSVSLTRHDGYSLSHV